MAEQKKATNSETHKPNFVEKIIDKITGHHHHGPSADKHEQHQHGGPPNAQDNADAAEASVAGAHAIPPMTTHADPNQQYSAQQQHPDQPQMASGQPIAEGQNLRLAEHGRQRPL